MDDETLEPVATDATEPVVAPVDDEAVIPVRRRRGRLFTWLKWLFGLGAVGGLVALVAAAVIYVRWTDELPTLEAVQEYSPPVMTRVHAGDGKLIAEYSKEARVFVPVDTIPDALQHAFVAAEDKRFYTHGGWDPIGLFRATLQAPIRKLRGQRIGGTSTLTQQVAKNFLTGDDYSLKRKVREIAIARRIEEALTKDEIIELYLNEIYFGRRSYGVAAASLNYFGKPMEELSLAEMTYLASLPKGPNNYRLDDERGVERAKNRQAYILGRMEEDGYITKAEADAAKAEPLEWVERLEGQEYLAAEYFNEEVRKLVFDQYGEDELYEGGLSIRTSVDTSMQLAARRALREGLEAYDRRHGWRGALGTLDADDWEGSLRDYEAPKDIGGWHVGVVTKVADASATVGYLVPEAVDATVDADAEDTDLIEEVEMLPMTGTIPLSATTWAGEARADGKVGPAPKSMKSVVSVGDVVLVEPFGEEGQLQLRQIPAVNGAIMAMDPHTGRVLALVGGYSFQQSQFNRATQAYRQPGSSFKPFVYAAALENGYTPSSQVLDAPFVIENADNDCADGGLRGPNARRAGDCQRYYKPSNYSAGQWYGLSTLRLGLEKSRNAMTVRLANDIGMGAVGEIGERFGIYDDVPGELAWSLGAGETTLFRHANAYSMMINGGKRITPSILDRVQDASGRTIFRHPEECVECYQEEWTGQAPPDLVDDREQVIDPVTAYQTMFMMQGVVENGTGRTIAELGRPLGGKTGTTNDYKDAWFVGFSPDLVVGVYVGFDTPQQMGTEGGGNVAAPIFKEFMRDALADVPLVPFRIPDGVSLAPVNRDTGEPSFIGAENYILEAFRPGTEPQIGGSTTSSVSFGGSGGFGFGDMPLDDEPLDDEPLEGDFMEDDMTDDADTPPPGRSLQGGQRPLTDEQLEEASGRGLDQREREGELEREAQGDTPRRRIPPPPTPPGTQPRPENEKPVEDIDDGLY